MTRPRTRHVRPLAPRALPLLLALLAGCSAAGDPPAPPAPPTAPAPTREPIVGGPCEGCEAVFEGLPARPGSTARIAPAGEPGEPMRITGMVRHGDGTPAPGTIVYAYHTNAEGRYPPDASAPGLAARRHGRLRGWARAGDDGRFAFDTIRPGGYPGASDPAHVHLHVLEPDRCTYWIDDLVFIDDPRLDPDALRRVEHGRGGSGIATPRRGDDGTWLVVRDVVLGERIPDYPARARW